MKSYILRKTFNIRPDEFKKAEYLIAFFFAVGFYFTLVGSISISIFDMRFGAKYLPFIFFLFPVLNIIFSYVYMKVLPKISKRRLFRYFFLLVLIIHIFSFLILKGVFEAKIFFAVFLLLCMIVNEKLYFISMIVIQDVVDVESIKRILPLSTAVFTIASLIAAFLIRILSEVISGSTIFLISGVFIFFIARFADVILKKYKTVPDISSSMKDEGFSGTFKYIKDNSFLFMLILLAVAVDIAYNVNDYLYNVIASGAIPQEAKFIGFVGTTETVRYFLTLVVDLFLFTRIITKLGSLNVVKIVFINAILGTALILLGSNYIYIVMSSKIIFTVLVMLLCYSLMQILYQPVHQRYKEKVMVIADVFVSIAGSLIGGLITLMHAYGYLSGLFINVFTMVVALAMLVLWQMKQSGFIKIIEKSMNFTDNLDISKLLGKIGMASFLPYMKKKAEHGKTFEKTLMLDILKHADFEGKEKLFKDAMQHGELEIRMKIVDMAFEGSIPFEIIIGNCKAIAGDSDIVGYIIYNLFLNYKKVQEKGTIEALSEIKAGLDKTKLKELQLWMLEYLYEGNKKAYEQIVQYLSISKKSSDIRVLLQIMNSFVGVEDEINRSALLSIMLNLKGYQGILKDTVELCSIYDRDMDMMYLKEVFSGYCQHEVVERVCTCYGAETVIGHLKDNTMLIPKIYVLHAATMESNGVIKDYYEVYQEVKEKLKGLVKEKIKIQKSHHSVKVLLCEEIDRLTASIMTAVLDFAFLFYGVPTVNYLEKHLSSEDGKKMILEIVKNSLPLKVSNDILPIMEERLEIEDEKYCYSSFIVGGMHQIITNLYMILGGEVMEVQFSREIETVAILKGTSVFKGLDIESLFELLRIGEFVGFQGDEVIVKKGDAGDNLYVVIEGEAGIYQNEDEDFVAAVECGEMFGEEDVIDRNTRMTTVKTFDEAVLFKINGDDFVSLLKTNNELAFSLLEVLAGHLRSAMKEIPTDR